MKILHLTLSFSHGGRREAIANLASGLATLGVENHLGCINRLDCNELESTGVFKKCFELDRHRLFDVAALTQLRRYCRTQGIDFVHAHDAASLATATLAMPWSPPRLLMTFHRTLAFESARRRDRLRNALTGLRASAIVVASEDRRRHYIEQNFIASDKVVRIPLGIDLTRFHPDSERRAEMRQRLHLSPQQRVIGAVGHYGSEKGLDVVIDAFQRLGSRPDFGDAVLVLIGTGTPEQQTAIQACIAPEFAARIHLAGFQSHTEDWIAGFDLLLHGPRAEAFGLVLVEAMACGVPVVASAVGGIPDVLEDGASGRLVPVADPGAMAEAAASLLSAPATLRQLAAAAAHRACAEFDVATCARRHLALYQSLGAGQRPNPNTT